MKKNIFILFLVGMCFSFLSCNITEKKSVQEKKLHQSASALNIEISKIQQAQKDAITYFVNNLPEEQKISQLFLVNIVGNEKFEPIEHVMSLYDQPGRGGYLVPGGCLYFSYNIASSAEKMISFNDSIVEFCKKNNVVPPFLTLDQEGGMVCRLRGLAGPLPSNERVASCLSIEQAYRLYSLQSEQMKALGFHLNLAPVVEPAMSENKDFLVDRSFGNPQAVLDYGFSAINGFENNGIGTVLKHFPGNTNTDPHTGLPEILWTKEEVEQNCINIFSRLSLRNPAGILMSHARMACEDSETPACLSSFWVNDVLREKMNYSGIIFSDDIFMDALQKNGFTPEKAAVMAINAGVDCIMLSEKRFAPIAKILLEEANKNQDFSEKIEKAVRRIIDWKIKQNILCLALDENGTWKVEIPETEPVENRIQLFLNALTENIDLYRTYFAPSAK